MNLYLSGDPRPAPRPRVTRHGTHYPSWYEAQSEAWALEANAQIRRGGWRRFEDARLCVTLQVNRATHHRADFDNISKAVTDALNGVAYYDDAQIDEAHVYIRRGVGEAAAGVRVTIGRAYGRRHPGLRRELARKRARVRSWRAA